MNGKSTRLVIFALCMGILVGLAAFPAFADKLLGMALVLGLAAAAWIDTNRRIIPNWITYPLIILGLVINLAITVAAQGNQSFAVGLQASFSGAAICFSLMLVLFLANATGGGDVKLAAGVGAFLGPADGLMSIAWCHLLAGGVVVVWMLSRISIWQLVSSVCGYCKVLFWTRKIPWISLNIGSVANKRVPMAAFFALGVLVTQLGYRLW